MNFKVKVENFEGPLDVLLQMIEKKKLSVNDISLADIADDYLVFVKSLSGESLARMTYFMFIASTLVLIKSKSLLPQIVLSEEEEADIEELKRRIQIFKMYQEAAKDLGIHFAHKRKFFPARQRKQKIAFRPHQSMRDTSFTELLSSIFREFPQKETKKKEAYVKIALHIEEMMDSLSERIKKITSLDFHQFVRDSIPGEKSQKKISVYKLVSFLAMLELVKNGILEVFQEDNFKTISLASSDEEKLKEI